MFEVAVPQLLLLLLVGRHPLEPGVRGDHAEEQVELGVLGDGALDEDRRLLRVEAGGQPVDDHVLFIGSNRRGLLVARRERVPVGREEEALEICAPLERHPVHERAVKVAQVELSGGTHPADDALPGCCGAVHAASYIARRGDSRGLSPPRPRQQRRPVAGCNQRSETGWAAGVPPAPARSATRSRSWIPSSNQIVRAFSFYQRCGP